MPSSDTSSPSPDPYRKVFHSTDPERTSAFLTTVYKTAQKITASAEGHRFRHVLLGPGPFYLNNLHYIGITENRAEPHSALAVVRMHRGVRTRLDLDHQLGPGELALHGQFGESCHLRYVSVTCTGVIVPLPAAAEVARNRPDDDLPPLRFASLRPTGPAAARHWLDTVQYVTRSLCDHPESMTQPLVNGATSRLLAAALLTTFPSTWITEPHHHDRVDATPTALSRAIAFIETNADLDISAADIARAAYVTVRAVQLAFRRHLGTTPMAYLRRVRLEHAHEQLLAATPDDGTTVTEIAARWGFADASRFTARYRLVYGQPPSHTLRT